MVEEVQDIMDKVEALGMVLMVVGMEACTPP